MAYTNLIELCTNIAQVIKRKLGVNELIKADSFD